MCFWHFINPRARMIVYKQVFMLGCFKMFLRANKIINVLFTVLETDVTT